jgi:tetratricopeptide (TPR) repeat protein
LRKKCALNKGICFAPEISVSISKTMSLHKPARLMVRWLPISFWLFCSVIFFRAPAARAQSLEDTQQEFLQGKYQDVIMTAKKQVAEGSSNDWRILLVQSLLAVGRYGEAYTNAQNGLTDYPIQLRMFLLAREAALYQNDLRGANRMLSAAQDFIEQRRGRDPRPLSSQNLVAMGEAMILLGVEPQIVLENCYRQAERMDPPPREAFLGTGNLALNKHDYSLAADAFRAGLKKFPDDPDMNAGLAKAFESGDRAEMMKAIEAALKVNPHHVPALLILADHLIDAEQYDEADKQLDLVLKVNPNQPEALAYRSVLAHLRNDPEKEKASRTAALKFYQTNPEVDYLIGKKLAQKYRFAEGAAAQWRALDFEPDFLPAQRELAEDLLRLGQNDAGWDLAETAHKKDAYDVTAYNLTMLHDRMEKFATLTNAHFIVHMSASEAGLYGDRVLDLLERARERLTKKYGVALTQPTEVEIFPDQKDFAVRTFGMPGNPGYLGVCFGSVITANSPASQLPNPANWEDVLWHEFTHVITLTATRNRMPRWLSEGISVYEERQANPLWGEKMNLGYREMILNNELTPLGKLSGAFLGATNSEHLLFAYYESSLVVQFIVDKYGLDSLKKILGDLHDGVEINPAIAAHTEPMADLEKKFDAFARDAAAKLAPGADLTKPPDLHSETERDIWKMAHPNNYYIKIENATDLMKAKKWAEAKPILESAIQIYHGESKAENPMWMLAATERNLHDTNAELATLEKFATQETDFADLYSRLVELCRQKKDWTSVTNYADRMLAINPLSPVPHRGLAEAGVALGNNEMAIVAYRKLLSLDPPDPSETHYQLAKLLHARGNAEPEAKRNVLEALEEAPRFRDAQRLLLDLEKNTPQPQASAAASGVLSP